MSNSPLISQEGFEYLSNLLEKNVGKHIFENLLTSIVLPKRPDTFNVPFSSRKIKAVQKDVQISGVMESIPEIFPRRVLDVGCGNGLLSIALAERFPKAQVIGIDLLPERIKKNKLIYKHPNLVFKTEDADNYRTQEIDLVTSLHGCGNLTDRAIDFAVEHKATIVCVPCCYSKIKRKESQIGDYILPRSNALVESSEYFRKKVLKAASRLEGCVSDDRRNTLAVIRDVYRLLINIDRLLYMREHNYRVDMTIITPQKLCKSDGEKHANTSCRYALIGISTQ